MRHSFNLEAEAVATERAVGAVLDAGARTGDLLERPDGPRVAGSEMARLVADAVIRRPPTRIPNP
ncbi:MAG: hypothetical protein NTV05_05840 [Acidobacteria bacterium]|nr:hypothetical protein [Acidobacteriota bacterium]